MPRYLSFVYLNVVNTTGVSFLPFGSGLNEKSVVEMLRRWQDRCSERYDAKWATEWSSRELGVIKTCKVWLLLRIGKVNDLLHVEPFQQLKKRWKAVISYINVNIKVIRNNYLRRTTIQSIQEVTEIHSKIQSKIRIVSNKLFQYALKSQVCYFIRNQSVSRKLLDLPV